MSDDKQKFLERVYGLAGKFTQIIVVTVENVTSNQIQAIRRIVYRGGGTLIIGKNTIVRKAIQLRATNDLPEQFKHLREKGAAIPELANVVPLIKNKVGLIFTNESVFELKPKLETFKVQAAAKVGAIAPIDVVIPPGTTGMDPSQISFFHALQVSTKIDKGMIAITKDYQVCFAGKKIGTSQVALLQKMGLKPFTYGMTVTHCYEDGSVLDGSVLSIKPESLLDRFQSAVRNTTAVSLNLGIPTAVSVPHSIVNAFKNLAAIGLQINYKFPQIANAGSAPAPAPAAKETKAAAPAAKETKAAPPPPPKEEDDDMAMGDLFG